MKLRVQTNLPGLLPEFGEMARLFDPTASLSADAGDALLIHEHSLENGQFVERWRFDGQQCVEHTEPAVLGGLAEKRTIKRAAKTGLFLLLRQRTGIEPPWGSLTGIRPTRLMYEAIEQGVAPEQARSLMTGRYFVSPERAQLLADILAMQRGLIEHADDAYDLYIGIPFCTTRCSYCSFSSGTVDDGKLLEPYLAALSREMRLCADLMDRHGMRLRAAYMGGGTPTALSAAQLDRLLEEAMRLFPGAREWTVEAGRPDTIDRDKLRVLKAHNIGRISVNPQSFSDDTLCAIGRAHTAGDTVRAFELARVEGFDHINMDLIAALPGEDERAFERSLNRAIELSPESVTVHTLAIKHGSVLHEHGGTTPDAQCAANMVELARERLCGADYRPYYLYRQKYMAGNLENVGYAKPGCACVYNIDIMEESCKVLALGAGAISKWLFPRERRIERAPNVKNIEQYIDRVDEMFARKLALIGENR